MPKAAFLCAFGLNEPSAFKVSENSTHPISKSKSKDEHVPPNQSLRNEQTKKPTNFSTVGAFLIEKPSVTRALVYLGVIYGGNR